MENASKALIIAGAILLSILIIALGIFIYSQARSAMNMDQIDAQVLAAFNSPIEEYEGSRLGSNLRTLMSNLISGAGTYKGSADYLPSVTLEDTVSGAGTIEAEGGEEAATNNEDYMEKLSDIRAALVNTHYYTVSLSYGTNSGLVNKITIEY